MEYEFDNSNKGGNLSIEWRHVSAVRTHHSVKSCPNPPKTNPKTMCLAEMLAFQLLIIVTQPLKK